MANKSCIEKSLNFKYFLKHKFEQKNKKGTSRPLAGRDALGAWEKIWYLPPVGWAGGFRPHASRPLIGWEVPIFQKFPKRHPFFEFNFLTLFAKKFSKQPDQR
jgi:hypothetical protein